MGDASPGRMPVAVCKDDRAEPVVVLRLEDFVTLWTRARGGER